MEDKREMEGEGSNILYPHSLSPNFIVIKGVSPTQSDLPNGGRKLSRNSRKFFCSFPRARKEQKIVDPSQKKPIPPISRLRFHTPDKENGENDAAFRANYFDHLWRMRMYGLVERFVSHLVRNLVSFNKTRQLELVKIVVLFFALLL